MAVLPINSVSVETNQYTFTGRKDKKNSHKANPLAGLPVVVMLAMTPLSTDGKQPAQFVPIDSAHLTELVAAVNANAPKTYAETQAPQKANLSELKAFEDLRLQKIVKCIGNDQDANLVFTTLNTTAAAANNSVRTIYYVKDNYKEPDRYGAKPPSIDELRYHDLGENSFVGIRVYEFIYTKTGGKKLMTYEVRLDDKSVQYLIDFLAGETEFKNNTTIKFTETKSQNLLKPKVI